MTVTLRSLDGLSLLSMSNEDFTYLIRRGVFLSAGVFALDEKGDTLWVPEGWSGSAHDGWSFGPELVPPMIRTVNTLQDAYAYGRAKARPWVSPDDHTHYRMLDMVRYFLQACKGFTTS